MINAVTTINLTKKYTETLAVDNININIPAGSTCGFLGRNGAGKTTTIRMLVGLCKPTAGEINIMGEQRIFGKQGTPTFGYLPDVPNFYGYMTGKEFLDLSGKLCQMPDNIRKERIQIILKQVGLDGVRQRISGYSRGMKQRLGVAQAMINNPPVIFLDEPISALDPMGRKDVADIIRNLKETTVVLSTHILADVEDICDYVLIIEKGNLLAADYKQNLRREYADNTTKVRFYEESDLKTFTNKASDLNIDFTSKDPLEIDCQRKDTHIKELNKIITGILYDLALPVESHGSHIPTMDDIFHKVLTKYKGEVTDNV